MQDLIYKIASGAESLSLGERLTGGLLVAAFSMLMVFAVLLFLMYVIKGLGLAFADKKAKGEKLEPELVLVEEKSDQTLPETDEDQLMAAIIGAISCMKTSENSKIVVRQIAKNQSNWSDTGLVEQINSRL